MMKRDKMLKKSEPVQDIEVSDKHTKLRITVVIVAAVAAIVAFGFGISNCISEEKGWKTLSDDTGMESSSADFSCRYFLEKDGQDGKKLLAEANADYIAACSQAYKIFNAQTEFANLSNLASLNKSVNTVVTVDEALYSALSAVKDSGSRALYLAPAYTYYYSIFYATDDGYAEINDPARNEDVAAKFTQISAYANNPEHVDLKLLGENKVRLCVSDEYARFVSEEEYGVYLDFFILKNAFIADYIADYMAEKGHGVLISSIDGYVKSTLSDEITYTLNVFDRDGNYENLAAAINCKGKMSAVRFRNYNTDRDLSYDYFYTYSDGGTVTPYLDENGLNRSCTDNLLAYSYSKGCAEVMLKALPVYTSDELEYASISHLKASSVYTIYCEGKEVRYNDTAMDENLKPAVSEEYSYTKKYYD